MDMNEQPITSWGNQCTELDVRALRRYQRILSNIALAGEVIVFTLIFGLGLSLVWLFQTNFENAIFWDGTETTCVLDGKTGEIISAQ